MIAPTYSPGWPEDVQAVYRHDMQEIWDRKIAPHIWIMYHDELRRYLRAAGTAPCRILDVGCAQGTLALRLAEQGHHVRAMDIRPQFVDYARSRYEYGDVEFVVANAMEHVGDDRYDLVFANQILEHLVYPSDFIRRLSEWLVPGGRLICTTPSATYLKSHLPTFTELGDPREHEHKQFSADGDGHFFAYTPTELASVMHDADLHDVQVREYDTPWITGHMKVRLIQPLFPDVVLRIMDRFTLAIPLAARRLGYQLWAEGRSER